MKKLCNADLMVGFQVRRREDRRIPWWINICGVNGFDPHGAFTIASLEKTGGIKLKVGIRELVGTYDTDKFELFPTATIKSLDDFM